MAYAARLSMGILEELGKKRRRYALGARCLIGRHPACDLRVNEASVSGEHAIVRWVGGQWELRDLGSWNGTFLDGRRLASGERVPLRAGAVVKLGAHAGGFMLIDAEPPVLLARRKKTGETRTASDAVLVLPDDAQPRAILFEDPAAGWVIERENEEEREIVVDHDLVFVDGETWVIELPSSAHATWKGPIGLTLEAVALRFTVSRDEEHTEVAVLHQGRAIVLTPRSYHYMLLTLARARIEDAAAPPAERGWIDRETLCAMLQTDHMRLNVDVHRARKQLSDAGVYGANGLIERRPASGQLRLGVEDVEVVSR
jgi:pSer/pThr/pTyr-binding forkhead associated (FHA) protein